jgi:peptidyl-prolyl cis-trans isomerase D
MISFLNKYKKIIFIATVSIFVIGVFFGLGAYVYSGNARGAIAEVNGKKIEADKFYTQVQRVMENLRNSNTEVNEIMEKTVKQQVLREMILEEILYQEASKLKLGVSNFEVAAEIQTTPQFYYEKHFDPRMYVQTIWSNFKMTPPEYEKWRKKARMGNKLKYFIYSSIKITPQELKDEYILSKNQAKDFEKKKDEYMQQLKQKEFMETANYMLRQIASKTEIKTYLDNLEKNARS